MKSTVKQFLMLIFSSYLAYFLILNQGLIGGLMVAGTFLLVCTILFLAGMIGAIKGKLRFLKLKSISEAVGMLIFSSILFLVVLVVAVINSFVVFTTGDDKQASDDKVRLFASTVFQVSSQKELMKTEKNGVIYFYSEKTEAEIAKMDEVLQRERQSFNSFLGTSDEGGLTVEFHDDYGSLESSYGSGEVAGYYNLGNKSIHLVPTDENWELILVHEYSHYQSHLFSNQYSLPITRIPSWFEEGIADYFADDSSGWYDLKTIELIDFHDLDSQEEYDSSASASYDPYAQGFLTVESLVDAYGEGFIVDLLKSRSTSTFYNKLETMIGMEIEEYQDIFLEKMIAEQEQLDEWYELSHIQFEQKDYEGAEKTATAIKEAGDIYDNDAADWMLVDIQLARGNFMEAADLMNRKIAADHADFLIDDLFLLAAIYLLIDPQLSLESALQAEKLQEDTEFYFYEEDLMAIYEKINSSKATEGYRQLLDEEWLYNPYVLDRLNEKLDKEYPGEF